ncbi:hypothetical protein Ahy_B01g053172 [Arachis hypogaea]|uniref:Aminotransferase-like plant mobile domain-containing protein n=1 Tax=Arachis hypogaea TaxID=3818 RepID=A0A445AR85_ARAHY|nr:hypothetical protein Ahy_B01g053172 [Arachis hypogaea]
MMLLSTHLFGDKSANQIHIRWLSFVARLDDVDTYSWGSAALAWLYRCMCRVANKNARNLAGPRNYYHRESSGGSPFSGRMDLTTFLFCWHPGRPLIYSHLTKRATNYPVSYCIRLVGWSRY